MPYLYLVQQPLLYKENEGIKTPLPSIVDTYLLSNILDLDSKEEEFQHDSDIELTPQRDIDPDPTSTSF